MKSDRFYGNQEIRTWEDKYLLFFGRGKLGG